MGPDLEILLHVEPPDVVGIGQAPRRVSVQGGACPIPAIVGVGTDNLAAPTHVIHPVAFYNGGRKDSRVRPPILREDSQRHHLMDGLPEKLTVALSEAADHALAM